MTIIGCDLHTRQQTTMAMLDTKTGKVVQRTLKHQGANVREFYSAPSEPVRVGIEASGTMYWFLKGFLYRPNPEIPCALLLLHHRP